MTLTVPPAHSFLTTNVPNVDLFPAQTELTVAQAAAQLDVPEGYVDELLEDDLIEHRWAGSQRLIDHAGLLKYQQDRERGRVFLDEMVRLNQEMGLYDD